MSADRMLELLTEQTERPLSAGERAELERLLDSNPKWRASDFELAAAASALAFLGEPEPMPAHLTDKVMAEVEGRSVVDRADTIAVKVERIDRKRPSRVVTYGGWVAAAAAVILLAIILWPKPKPPATSPAAERQQLLAKGITTTPWSTTEDPLSKGTAGDVVWDNTTQTGFMRFTGLAPNDPTKNQYQLWIFDGTRPTEHPIDGGVFDVGPGGEVIVPIDAKIRVFEPTMFAVTLERPGGVVVSTRERLVVLAKVSS